MTNPRRMVPMETEIRPGTTTRTVSHSATPVQQKSAAVLNVRARIAAAREGGNDVVISPRVVDVPVAAPRQVPAVFVPAVALPIQKADPTSGAIVISAPPAVSSPNGIQIVMPSPDVVKVPPAATVGPTSASSNTSSIPFTGGGTGSSSEGSFTADVTTAEQVAAEQKAGGGLSIATLLGGGAVGFFVAGPIGGAVGAVLGYLAGRSKS